ncbi:cell division regulator GpsB [Paucilactobacillus nenjiangensis]|uniref:Cell cycle protein GpsB n=1 Tax=Paucilactobacillus nenjiangensis TaxID=1296540 RepID=A0A5P1X3B3_9LACO|nr:cell division regulator GpsB [Paucilactobacillus nenjiangensis]QER67394.1 cell division regulator GpsB [Paucilactobacillus nenjiangensis]
MDNIIFSQKDILTKEFKEKRMGSAYDPADVDAFLDDVIKDYDTYSKEITRLNDENERLRAKVDELNRQVEVGTVSAPRPAAATTNTTEQPVSNATNMDILKRLSNLERRVFGSQLDNGQSDSHLI